MAFAVNNTFQNPFPKGLVSTGTQTSTPEVSAQPASRGMVFPVGANMSAAATNNAENTLRGLIPTTPLKSVIQTTDGQGSTTTRHDFHAPVVPNSQNTTASIAPHTVLPLTGNVQVPSGATVNPNTGALVTAPTNPSPANTATFPGIVSTLANTAQGNIPIGQQAKDIGNFFSPKIAAVTRGMIGQQTGDLSTGTAPVGEGAAQLAASAAGQELQGLSSAEQAQLAAINPQLTAEQQAQAGLASEGGLAQPQFNPSTLSFFNPLTASASVPQPTTYTIQAGDTLNTIAARNGIPVDQLEAANPQITDVNKIDVGQQITIPPSGGQFGTGPAAAANAAAVAALQTQVISMSAARSAVNSVVQNQLNPFLQSNNVNPSDLNAVNALIQTVARNTSSPQYKELSNLMTDIAQSYSPVFVAQGQDPSVWVSQTTQGLLDATASGQTISQIISSLDSQAQSKIAGYQSTINALEHGQNINPAPSSSTANETNTSSGSFSKGQTAAGGQLKWNGSQWVVNS